MPTLTMPTIRNGWYAIHPLTQEDRAPVVRVLKFRNGQEQRFTTGAPLLRGFTLTYHALNDTDRLALDAFVASTLGDFDSSWTFNLGVKGVTPTPYVDCTFTQNSFTWTQSTERPTLWDGSIQFRQTNGTYPDIGSDGTNTVNVGWTNGLTSYFPPSLRAYNGTTTVPYLQNPYKRSIRYKNASNDLENGLQYSYAFFGSGLTNFPTRGLYSWELAFPSITDSDCTKLENHWISRYGSLMPFFFIDPTDGATYNVRYDMATLEIKRLNPNQNSVTIKLTELFYGPVGTAGYPNPRGGSVPVASMTLYVDSAYTVNGTFAATSALRLNSKASGGIIYTSVTWARRTDSFVLTTMPNSARFDVEASSNATPFPNTWLIYDVYIILTFVGGGTQTLRPTANSVNPLADPTTGSISNPTNAYDGNPATFATVESHTFGVLGIAADAYMTMILTGFN